MTRYSHAVLITGARTWDDETAMRRAFSRLWHTWGSGSVTRPVLISGQCPDGADAMAERLWRAAGLETLTFPAQWRTHGRAAGFRRNEQMVRTACLMRDAGTQVCCTAFLDLCHKQPCGQRQREQLLPGGQSGHYSHGTIHCRSAALRMGLGVMDVIRQH